MVANPTVSPDGNSMTAVATPQPKHPWEPVDITGPSGDPVEDAKCGLCGNGTEHSLHDLEYVPVKPGANPNPPYYRVGPDGEKTEITRAEFKEHRRKFMTVKHQTVPSCGHKFRPQSEPKERNCDACWFTFFQTHGELTQAADEVFSKFGEAGLRQLRGKKFTKNFLSFMSTVANWKVQVEKGTITKSAPDEQNAGVQSVYSGEESLPEQQVLPL